MFYYIDMKRFLTTLLALALLVGAAGDLQAQSRGKSGKKKTTVAKKGSKTKKKGGFADASTAVVTLPPNCNDCLFAIELKSDEVYGPTTAPDGPGRILEVVADKAHPNVFEREHNSVWYKFKVPYNGMLEIEIEQVSQWDDYDFLVYKNTGMYFSNQVMLNKVSPVAVNMGAVDSASLIASLNKATTTKSTTRPVVKDVKGKGKGKASADALPPVDFLGEAPLKPTIGMKVDAKHKSLSKKELGGFIKSIPVRMGEEYYIVLDNRSDGPSGHRIRCSVHADAYDPLLLFYDRKAKRYVDVDLMVLERGGSQPERTVIKDEHYRGGRVKLMPDCNYTIYAKREGYFSVLHEFNASDRMAIDTMLLYHLERTDRGSTFKLSGLYFDEGSAAMIGNFDSVLSQYVYMFRNHPEVSFLVKNYIQSYGVDIQADMLLSLNRAKAVKDYFVKNGIAADRITTAGMSKNEITRAAAAALNRDEGFSPVSIEIIITGVGKKE